METQEILRTLEHLSYIMECILIDANGEADYELYSLAAAAKKKFGDDPDCQELIDRLEAARDNFSGGRDRSKARGQLSALSRSLWKASGIAK